MVHEDQVSCEGCGAEITHVICGYIPSHDEDPDYYLCDECQSEE